MRLGGKVAIVTGAGSGIGRAIAHEMSRQGAQVVAADINEAAGRETLETMAGSHARPDQFMQVDVSSFDSVQHLVDKAVRSCGRVDIMVNNAGVECRALSVLDMPVEEYHRTLAVNQHGCFYGIKAAGQAMKEGGGVIINTASVYGVLTASGQLPYVAGKAAVIGMTRSAARDLARYNIRVVAVAPGLIDTPMAREQLADPRVWEALERAHLRRQAGKPEDVATLVAFLAGDEASFLNGHVYFADDGYATFKP